MAERQKPTDRLEYTGDLGAITERLCAAYNIGSPLETEFMNVGYEDCNVVLETEKGKYLAKMFAKTRTSDEIVRYSTIMKMVAEAGVNHPELLTLKSGELLYADSGISLVCMRFIEGKTFFELDRAPNPEERKLILEQTAKINRLDYRPGYYHNSWAIPHIREMYDGVKQYIETDDRKLVERAMLGYESIPVKKLPSCFAHGDLAKTNVLKGDDGKVYVLDFSVANWYPRILDLAVIAANLMYDESSDSLEDKCSIVAEEYGQYNLLTSEERRHLPAYALAGFAMEFMGAYQEKYINGLDNEETTYWLELGRKGLSLS